MYDQPRQRIQYTERERERKSPARDETTSYMSPTSSYVIIYTVTFFAVFNLARGLAFYSTTPRHNAHYVNT